MRFIIFALAILAVIVGFLQFQPQKQPFALSEDLAVPTEYVKKQVVSEKISLHQFTRYTQETKKFFATNDEKDLVGLRCSDTFWRTSQGVYILENTKTKKRMLKRVKNGEFIEFMRNHEPDLPKGNKILSARVCETEDQTLIVLYSSGIYDAKLADTAPTIEIVTTSLNNTAFVHIVPQGLFAKDRIIKIADSKNYLHCDEPFLLNKKSELFVLCSDNIPWLATYYVYRIQTDNGTVTKLNTCTNNFKEKLSVACD